MTHPAKAEGGTVTKTGRRPYAVNPYLPNPGAAGTWFDMASAWDAFGRWTRQRYADGKSGDINTDALYRDQAILLEDFWTALEKFESELPEEKLPRQQRLFDIDRVRRVS